jgi:hypothetical protein
MTMHHLYGWLNAIVVFLLLLDLPTVLAQTINIEAARKEGKVIAYGTIIPQVMDPLHRNLEKKYGVKVEYWRASATQVMERALSEWQAGRPGFDVTFAINGAQAILKPVGVFAKYTPASSEKFPPLSKTRTAWSPRGATRRSVCFTTPIWFRQRTRRKPWMIFCTQSGRERSPFPTHRAIPARRNLFSHVYNSVVARLLCYTQDNFTSLCYGKDCSKI